MSLPASAPTVVFMSCVLKVTFPHLVQVDRVDMMSGHNCYVSQFYFLYSNTSSAWHVYRESSLHHKVAIQDTCTMFSNMKSLSHEQFFLEIKTLMGPTRAYQLRKNYLTPSVYAVNFRIAPRSSETSTCMRLELFGQAYTTLRNLNDLGKVLHHIHTHLYGFGFFVVSFSRLLLIICLKL